MSPQAHMRNPQLSEFWTVRETSYKMKENIKTVYTLLTVKQYRTSVVANHYLERWEIKLGFLDIKSSMP